MKLITLVFVLIFLSHACSSVDESPTTTFSESELSPTFSEESVDKLFYEWILKYNKTYSSGDEMKKRRELFKKKLEHVLEFNKGNHSHKIGLNEFSVDTEEESNVSCVIEDDDDLYLSYEPFSFNITSEGALPDSIDWRDHGAVTPVRKQSIDGRSCGSCWAFAATSAIESAWKIKNYDLIQLSPQQLIDCDKKSHGCQGGTAAKAFMYVFQHGIVKEEQHPYKAIQQPCHDDNIETTVKISSFHSVGPSEYQLMAALKNQPVAASIRVGEAFRDYEEGVFKKECGEEGSHAVTIVGYGGTDSGELYWIVKNSWGEDWGEDGYIRLSRTDPDGLGGGGGHCGIYTRLIYPVASIF